ncbi:MAG: ribose 5-phosphate isomerase B [Pseudobdellovibrio sp.]
MKVHIASDHAGIELKTKVVAHLKAQYLEVIDYGPFNTDSVDYPDFANLVCKNLKMESNQPRLSEFGILICGSGQGMALRANKFSHIRAALVYSDEISKLSREHNDANIICIGARFCTEQQALNWIDIFKRTPFAQGRHQTRVAKVSAPIA